MTPAKIGLLLGAMLRICGDSASVLHSELYSTGERAGDVQASARPPGSARPGRGETASRLPCWAPSLRSSISAYATMLLPGASTPAWNDASALSDHEHIGAA